jgi:hypothetical protein
MTLSLNKKIIEQVKQMARQINDMEQSYTDSDDLVLVLKELERLDKRTK